MIFISAVSVLWGNFRVFSAASVFFAEVVVAGIGRGRLKREGRFWTLAGPQPGRRSLLGEGGDVVDFLATSISLRASINPRHFYK